ncbi:hypothetical protein K504DRAFT_467506 [Pleomassaria siparia CBS 279.74]|uniref:Cupin type-2 domain-containing protein n=1 Tax=Pleomassaria siparia CBS 279.74 TaxID=1314801 RepID=A0A6G1K9U5_9PLEO|nr:hypothetical protein K504DRAFT_467506 [Pleomassaria siparia CBS 279.74]
MPAQVQVMRAAELTAANGSPANGMMTIYAFANMSDRFCGSVMIAKPHTASDVHHGDQDTIFYAANGNGVIVSGPNGSKRQELAPGDFALVPAFAQHQEVNDSDEDVTWIVTRHGKGSSVVHNRKCWGKS